MTIAELSQVKYKKREIALISEQIEDLYDSISATSDSVQSAAEFPYCKHTIKIAGKDITSLSRMSGKVTKLRERQRKLEIEVDRAEDFIEKLTDSQLRQIIELKYIRGMSWNMVAQRVYDYPDGDRARKKTERYFKNI